MALLCGAAMFGTVGFRKMALRPVFIWLTSHGLLTFCFLVIVGAAMIRSMAVYEHVAIRGQGNVWQFSSDSGFLTCSWTRSVRPAHVARWQYASVRMPAGKMMLMFVRKTLWEAHFKDDGLGWDVGLLGFAGRELYLGRGTFEVVVPYWCFAFLPLLLRVLRRQRMKVKGRGFEISPAES